MTQAPAIASGRTVPETSATSTHPRPRVLLVDDEAALLTATAANLRRRFDVVTALDGVAALDILERDPGIAVIVSDMRMPGLTGAQWLAQACGRGHDAVRILLTGYADVTSAAEAVNSGHIFRFLTKPCARAELESALDAAVAQHALVAAERQLLEETLQGSVKALVDVLALTHPALYGRAHRIKAHASRLAAVLEMKDRWQLEVAAMLSHLGTVALPNTTAAKLESGHVLSDVERQQVARIPAVTDQLLANIPRLESIRAILAAREHPPRLDPCAGPAAHLVAIGAHVLHAAALLEALESEGDPDPAATLARRAELDPVIVGGLEKLSARPKAPRQLKAIPLAGLRVGMVFGEDVRLVSGAMLVARGYEVTIGFLERLANFTPGAICEPVRILGGT